MTESLFNDIEANLHQLEEAGARIEQISENDSDNASIRETVSDLKSIVGDCYNFNDTVMSDDTSTKINDDFLAEMDAVLTESTSILSDDEETIEQSASSPVKPLEHHVHPHIKALAEDIALPQERIKLVPLGNDTSEHPKVYPPIHVLPPQAKELAPQTLKPQSQSPRFPRKENYDF